MKFTELIARPVMDLSTATSVGRIDDAVIDPSTGRLVGFVLKKTPAKADWLAWDRVSALGADAVTVASADALTDRGELTGRLLRSDHVVGGRVLSNQGWELASLADIELDPATGSTSSLMLADGRTVAAGDLIGIGRYATVVSPQA
jgi:sporulation protein YlmC with PRC-barrel domain